MTTTTYSELLELDVCNSLSIVWYQTERERNTRQQYTDIYGIKLDLEYASISRILVYIIIKVGKYCTLS